MAWNLLKLCPHPFAGVLSEQRLTESQWMWLQCHMALDEHLQVCPQCDAPGLGPYCAACGTRLVPETRVCELCQTPGAGAYCVQCGAVLRSATEEAIDAGTFDWDAWARRLKPFLGGLTAQEHALLRRERG